MESIVGSIRNLLFSFSRSRTTLPQLCKNLMLSEYVHVRSSSQLNWVQSYRNLLFAEFPRTTYLLSLENTPYREKKHIPISNVLKEAPVDKRLILFTPRQLCSKFGVSAIYLIYFHWEHKKGPVASCFDYVQHPWKPESRKTRFFVYEYGQSGHESTVK